ncbi:hypothetical protein [Nocardioides sp. SYSU DS0663]|uniref:hypothetical protein n=1 Tax=Nocardioides sp. SYSU DS0663 TaxID=3416445 RepID=UPI003F4C3A91
MTRTPALVIAAAFAVGAGSGLGYVDARPSLEQAAATQPTEPSGPAPVEVAPALEAFPPPVVADVAPRTAPPPQLVFPSSYSHPDIAPMRSYVPAPDHVSAPSGAAGAPSPTPVEADEPDQAGPDRTDEDTRAPQGGLEPKPEPKPGPKPGPKPEPEPEPQPGTDPAPEPTPEPDTEPTPEPDTEPTPGPEPTPTPTPTPTPEPGTDPKPEPAPEPAPQCADAAERGWECEVDETEADSAPEPAQAAAEEAALVADVPAQSEGTAYQLVVDLGASAVRVDTIDLDRAGLEEYLAVLREAFPDAFLTAVAPQPTEQQPEAPAAE